MGSAVNQGIGQLNSEKRDPSLRNPGGFRRLFLLTALLKTKSLIHQILLMWYSKTVWKQILRDSWYPKRVPGRFTHIYKNRYCFLFLVKQKDSVVRIDVQIPVQKFAKWSRVRPAASVAVRLIYVLSAGGCASRIERA